ncbi:MAG: hypothetical protein CMO01_04115 [Thalassobius sp.]|nr:hypothetical protein [Thalassovita sp.]
MAKKKFLNKTGISDIIQKAKEQEKSNDAQIKDNIVILDELEKLIFPLSDEEFQQLEENILAEGCREPLVLWKSEEDKFVLVDGHNRYKICKKNSVDFKILVKDFADMEAAKDWMINNQLGRRNVTEETKSWLRGLQYKREKKKQGWQSGIATKTEETATETANPKRTVQILAEQHNVSSSTIQRDEKFVDAVDALVGDDADLKKKILNKEIKIPKTQLIKLAEADSAGVAKIGKALKKGSSWKDAVGGEKATSNSNTEDSKVLKLKSSIFSSVEKAISEKDEKALAQSIKSLEQLRKVLFSK